MNSPIAGAYDPFRIEELKFPPEPFPAAWGTFSSMGLETIKKRTQRPKEDFDMLMKQLDLLSLERTDQQFCRGEIQNSFGKHHKRRWKKNMMRNF